MNDAKDDEKDKDIERTYEMDRRGVNGLRKDEDAIERRRKFKRDLTILMRNKDKRGFLEAIRAYGIKDGTPEFQRMVEKWENAVGRL